MGPVVLLHLPHFHFPEEADVPKESTAAELPMRVQGPRELVPLGVSIATGMPHSAHGLDGRLVLESDPLRLRARRFDDVPFPWVWDLVREAGRSTVVIGWPGINRAEGSHTPMVCGPALYGRPSDDGTWPLATPLVSSPDIRDALAAARIAPATVDLDTLIGDTDSGSPDGNESSRNDLALNGMVARLMSALRMLEHFWTAKLDLAVLSLRLPLNARTPSVLRRRLLDFVLAEIRGMMGAETTVVMVGKRAQHLALRIDTPATGAPEVSLDGAVCAATDIAPTLLALLDVPAPSHMIGRNLLDPGSRPEQRFELTASAPEQRSDIEHLVDCLEGSEGEALSEKRRTHLLRYGITHLRRMHRSSLLRIDFKSALKQAQLLVRLTSNPMSLWHVAFAASRSGGNELALETIRTLLAEHEGTPQAVLSVFLTSTSPSGDESRMILDSIDPNDLVEPTMLVVWARVATTHGRVDEGVEILSRMHERGRIFPMERALLTSALLGRGEVERALTALGPLGQAPNAPLNAKILRAKVFLAAGRNEDARMQANQIIAQAPHHPEAQKILDQLGA